MRRVWIVCAALLLSAGFTVSAHAQEADARAVGELAAFLPGDDAVPGWRQDGPLRAYYGDDLFIMIDGGADIYHEYGFVRVVSAAYADAEGQTVTLEFYEMKDPAAAYGIYTFKSGDGGAAVAIGQEARLQEYYLNFRKGNLLVTLVGSDSSDAVMQAMLALAKAVDGRIDRTGDKPELAKLFAADPDALAVLKYFRGPLGEMNTYVFDTKNIFHISEGVLGVVGGCRVFVFRYADAAESVSVYASVAGVFAGSSRFGELQRNGSRFNMIDRDGAFVLVRQVGDYIVVCLGQDRGKVESVSDGMLAKLGRRG